MSETEVLYIHPSKLPGGFSRWWTDFYSFYALVPMGVIGLVNLLREAGISVTGLNYAMEIDSDEDFDLEEWLREQVGVRVIMIDLHWYEHAFGAVEVAGICKKVFPEVPILLGGFTASLFAKEILENFSSVDFIIRGDAEKPLLQLIRQILSGNLKPSEVPNLSYRDSNRVAENPLTYIATSEDLDKLDFINIDFFENYQLYYRYQSSEFDVLTSHWLCLGRGCKSDCSFCGGGRSAHNLIAGREQIVLRSIKGVVNDIHRLHLMGIDQVSLSHDPAFMGQQYWSEFFPEIKKKDFKIGIYNEFFQLPSEEFLNELVDCAIIPHSQVVLSPLSGSAEVRRFNGKLFTDSQFFETLSHLKKYSFPVTIYFSTNLPLEENETFKATLQMAQKIVDFYPGELLKMANICHTIDPCSPMSLEPDKYFIEVNMETFMDYYRYCQLPPTVTSSEGIDYLRGFRAVPSKRRSVGDMVAQWRKFCDDKLPDHYHERSDHGSMSFETVVAERFHFRIPTTYSKRKEEKEEWGYGEYYNPQALGGDWKQFGMEGFIFYWTRKQHDHRLESMVKLCRTIIDDNIFQPGYTLEVEKHFEAQFRGYPLRIIKCRYEYASLGAKGPINFFIVNNTGQKRIYVFIVMAEQSNDPVREKKVIQFLEDNVIHSIEFI